VNRTRRGPAGSGGALSRTRGAATARFVTIGVLTAVFSLPFLWMVISSFKPRADIFGDMRPLSWHVLIPRTVTLDNYRTVIVDHGFLRPMVVTLTLAVVATVLTLVINSMGAYALAKIPFPGSKALLWLIIGTMFVVFEAKVVPLFRIMQTLHLQNTYFSIIAPWMTDAFFLFLFYQHFRGVPDELVDAARIDGASHFRTYRSVMLANIMPALISAAIIKMIFAFDIFLWPLLSITDESKTVVTVAIANLFSEEGVMWELVLAASSLATVPIIVLFLIFQRQYVEGVAGSGVKG
jgi:ABC-type glycerol-3-phosphate transport system permease component